MAFKIISEAWQTIQTVQPSLVPTSHVVEIGTIVMPKGIDPAAVLERFTRRPSVFGAGPAGVGFYSRPTPEIPYVDFVLDKDASNADRLFLKLTLTLPVAAGDTESLSRRVNEFLDQIFISTDIVLDGPDE